MRPSRECFCLIVFMRILLCLSTSAGEGEDHSSSAAPLHRGKRYVAFPEGSSFSTAVCMTIGMIGNPSKSYLSWAVNWGISYNLPTRSWIQHSHSHGPSANATVQSRKALIQRRSRRDVYEKLILVMNKMGYDGQACLNRILCETGRFIRSNGKGKGTMVEEIVKTIFSFPFHQLDDSEPDEHHYYGRMYKKFERLSIDCAAKYSQCEFSLLNLLLDNFTLPSRDLHLDYQLL